VFDPNAPSHVLTVQTGKALTAIACPSIAQCTAGDGGGEVLTFNPQTADVTPAVPVGDDLVRIACPSSNLCVAPVVGAAPAAAQGDPLSSAAWTQQPLATPPTTVSCPAVDECVIVDQLGSEVTGTVPAVAIIVPPPTAPPVARDKITGLTLAPHAFYASPRGVAATTAKVKKKPTKHKRTYGTIVSYRGSAAATTTFTVSRKRRGRRHAKTCGKPTKANRKGKACTFYTRVGSFTHNDAPGVVRLRFAGRISGHTLKPGSYRLDLVPRSSAGTGTTATKTFAIKKS
jgi:hypothetical protein